MRCGRHTLKPSICVNLRNLRTTKPTKVLAGFHILTPDEYLQSLKFQNIIEFCDSAFEFPPSLYPCPVLGGTCRACPPDAKFTKEADTESENGVARGMMIRPHLAPFLFFFTHLRQNFGSGGTSPPGTINDDLCPMNLRKKQWKDQVHSTISRQNGRSTSSRISAPVDSTLGSPLSNRSCSCCQS